MVSIVCTIKYHSVFPNSVLLVTSLFITKNVDDECAEVAVTTLLEFVLTKCKPVSLPVGYFGLLDELLRETPISAIFSSTKRQAYKFLNEHLENVHKIFENLVRIKLIKQELQIVLEVIKAIKDYEDRVIASDENFLSEPVVRIFKEMLMVK